MATHPVPGCYYAGMVTPVFDLEQTLSTSLRLIRRASKQAAFDLQQKETGSKTVAIATSKYASCGAFLSAQRACQIPIVLHHYLQRYSLLCVLTPILSHLTTSSVPNLHNAKILNISGTRGDMTKKKMPFFFTFKGLSNKPFFQ